MPITVTRLANEPILICTMKQEITADDVLTMFHESAALMQDMEEKVYRVTDTREAVSNFMDIIKIVREAASRGDIPGSSADPRVTPVFVGTGQMVRLGTQMMSQPQFGGVQIPMFETVADALTYIRFQIDKS